MRGKEDEIQEKREKVERKTASLFYCLSFICIHSFSLLSTFSIFLRVSFFVSGSAFDSVNPNPAGIEPTRILTIVKRGREEEEEIRFRNI